MKNNATTNHNQYWLARDVDRLLELRKNGYSIEYIANQLGRTSAATAVRHSAEMKKFAAAQPAKDQQLDLPVTDAAPSSVPVWQLTAAFSAGLAFGLLLFLV